MNTKSAFTLVELLVVITIIATLSTIGISSYSSSVKNARDQQRKINIEEIRGALQLHRSTNNFSYPNLTTMPTAIKLPVDPLTKSNSVNTTGSPYRYVVIPFNCTGASMACTEFTLSTKLENGMFLRASPQETKLQSTDPYLDF